jgi:hypothetical protein
VRPLTPVIDPGEEGAEGVHCDELVWQIADRHPNPNGLVDRRAVEVRVDERHTRAVVKRPLDCR